MQHGSFFIKLDIVVPDGRFIIWGQQTLACCILLTVFIYFFNIDFQRSKGGYTISEKKYKFKYVSSGVYSMTKCGKSGNKAVYNYKNNNFVIRRGRQNVTSESTPSGLLTS